MIAIYILLAICAFVLLCVLASRFMQVATSCDDDFLDDDEQKLWEDLK